MGSSSLSSQERMVSIAVLIASIGSIIFAVFMIGGYIFIPTLRTFRHRLILGLAVAEFFLALNFFAASFSSLVGPPLSSTQSSTFCSLTGFVTQIFFLMIDLWVLTIAVMTYLCIADKNRTMQFVQRHQVWLWVAIWLLSIAFASLGFGIWGYSDIGGFCWFESTKLRLILNYMPRWMVIVATLAIYWRTFVLIRRAQKNSLIRAIKGQSLSVGGSDKTMSPEVPTAAMFSAYASSGSTTLFSGNSRRESNFSVLERQRQSERQHERLRRTGFLMIAYPVCYAILWSIPTIVMIYHVSNLNDRPLPVSLDCLAKVTIALNGFISGHIYGFNERSQIAWVDLVVSKVLRIKRAGADRRASGSSNLSNWNSYNVGVEELKIGEKRKSSIATAPKALSMPRISGHSLDIESCPSSSP